MPQPLLARVPPQELPEALAEAHRRSMQIRGDATFFEVFGNHPELFDWYSKRFYGDVFAAGRVDRRIKEIIRLRLSTVHGCRFCNQGNRLDALDAGLSGSDVAAVAGDGTDALCDRDKAALKLADEMALSNEEGRLSAELYDELRRHFDDAEILEMGFVAGILSGVAKFLFAFDLVEREPGCPFPEPASRD